MDRSITLFRASSMHKTLPKQGFDTSLRDRDGHEWSLARQLGNHQNRGGLRLLVRHVVTHLVHVLRRLVCRRRRRSRSRSGGCSCGRRPAGEHRGAIWILRSRCAIGSTRPTSALRPDVSSTAASKCATAFWSVSVAGVPSARTVIRATRWVNLTKVGFRNLRKGDALN